MKVFFGQDGEVGYMVKSRILAWLNQHAYIIGIAFVLPLSIILDVDPTGCVTCVTTGP